MSRNRVSDFNAEVPQNTGRMGYRTEFDPPDERPLLIQCFPFWSDESERLVYEAAVEANLIALAAVGIAASVIGAFYYLKFIKVMFFDEPVDRVKGAGDIWHWVLLALAVLVISPLAWLATGWIGSLADGAAASLLLAG